MKLLLFALLVCVSNKGLEARGPFPSLGQHVVSKQEQWDGPLLKRSGRFRRSPTLADRFACGDGDTSPPTRVNTTARLLALRTRINAIDPLVDAYIIPMDDAHQSEYVSDHDKRLEYISGFAGSAGRAVVTTTKAALWTDGRYFLQADNELDCNWILMKQGIAGVPSIGEWLAEVVPAGGKVGADPTLLSYDSWMAYDEALTDVSLVGIDTNLIDEIWTDGRPVKPVTGVFVLDETKFAGETWKTKVGRVREEMNTAAVNISVFTALDEVAWLFNLRASDIAFNPVFFSYAMVNKEKVFLYIINHSSRLQNETLRNHLATGSDGTCNQKTDCVDVREYNTFLNDLKTEAANVDKVWVNPTSSYAAYLKLGDLPADRKAKAYLIPSIVRSFKGSKNPTEVAGMKNAYKRDSAALIMFMAFLEKEVKAGNNWTEVSASEELAKYRMREENNKGLSFDSISGFGPNGAIIHYRPSAETDLVITTSGVYLLDSGGQYLDGTTDVTRTFHFGTPSDMQKEAYTRVLMGSINLAMTVWPPGTYGRDIDVMARSDLWKVGLNYRHGTGHGIGAFLSVHEGPGRISMGYRETAYEESLKSNMFFSDEPGYYEDGEFGVRLETIVMTKTINTTYNFGGETYLGFEEFTLVPFEPHLINYTLLSPAQRGWLNDYNKRVEKEIGEEILQVRGETEAYDWLKARTGPIPPYTDGATCLHVPSLKIMLIIVTMVIILLRRG